MSSSARVPAGVPTGGRFAPAPRTEAAGVALPADASDGWQELAAAIPANWASRHLSDYLDGFHAGVVGERGNVLFRSAARQAERDRGRADGELADQDAKDAWVRLREQQGLAGLADTGRALGAQADEDWTPPRRCDRCDRCGEAADASPVPGSFCDDRRGREEFHPAPTR